MAFDFLYLNAYWIFLGLDGNLGLHLASAFSHLIYFLFIFYVESRKLLMIGSVVTSTESALVSYYFSEMSSPFSWFLASDSVLEILLLLFVRD